MKDILNGLNNKQYEAVINTDGPCLVIAGAGSGKTKVLTHKIAYLLNEKNIKPWNILAITFDSYQARKLHRSSVDSFVHLKKMSLSALVTVTNWNSQGLKLILYFLQL